MNYLNYVEFAQFRFTRNAEGNVIELPAQGMDERNLLVLDCERWGLARLHIFEDAAGRQDMLEAFQEELSQIADLRSDSVSRLITWGRDSGELFYADEMQDGEPLPDYLGRAGAVPFSVAGEWITQLFDLFELVPDGLPSFDRFTTMNFQVVIDRYRRVRPVFSEFYGWTKPGAHVQEHTREWHLAQIFCSLVAGVPVRTFSSESLPRTFDELPKSVQKVVLRVLSESHGDTYEVLKKEMRSLAKDADKHTDEVKLPRLLVRDWMEQDLADSYSGESEFAFEEPEDRESEAYAISAFLRGRQSHLQVLPGTDSIPREAWLNQHHDATRRPGRPMLHQLQVNYLEDRASLTLVGEERVKGVDLSTILLQLGPQQVDEARLIADRVKSVIGTLEQNTGSCPVWWLPPENVIFLTGTESTKGSVNLVERQGSTVWSEWGVKLRLHQTVNTLKEGVNAPAAVREMSRVPGKGLTEVRRSAVALPLIFFTLTCERFRWRRPVEAQANLPKPVSDLLERYRVALLNQPESVQGDLFEDFLTVSLEGEEADNQVDESIEEEAEPKEDGFEEMLDETLYEEEIELVEPAPLSETEVAEQGMGEAISAAIEDIDSDETGEVDEELDWDEDPEEAEAPRSILRFFKGGWIALWAVLAAVIVGNFLLESTSKRGLFRESEAVRFPKTDYKVPPPLGKNELIAELEDYLMQTERIDLLAHARTFDTPGSRRLLDDFMKAQVAGKDGAAARFLALMRGVKGRQDRALIDQLHKAARLGDKQAQFDLAALVLVLGREGVDPEEVRVLLDRSAKSQNPDARELLGVLLVDEDPDGALQLMLSAAKQNHLGALYHLGLFAANGVGSAGNPVAAATHFEAAATQGDPRAMFALGRCYELEFGKQADFAEATRWMKMAAALDHSGAQAWCQAREIEVNSGSKN